MSNMEDQLLGFPDTEEEIKRIELLYTSAIRVVIAKLENLYKELEVSNARNPVQSIQYRLKSPQSIRSKMLKLNVSLNIDAMQRNILDIAGVRIICSYIEDIYRVAEMLKKQEDIDIIRVKDYIETPKPNGYRSFHLLLMVPVYFSRVKYSIPVEIQMRTIAMDFWASLEHQLRYKSDGFVSDSVKKRLLFTATLIHRADIEMQNIYQLLHKME